MSPLAGTRVLLRAPRPGDEEAMVRWGADPQFAWYQWGRAPGRWTLESAREWLARFAAPAAAVFIIELGPPASGPSVGSESRRAIGFANYRDLQPKPRSAEIGIGIGEPALWGTGLGREALSLLIRHLQDDLGLHRIALHVLAYNDRAIAAYKACGFEVEGIERDGVMTDRGFYVNDVAMALVTGAARPAFDPRPVTLAGAYVRLEPLRMEHAEALRAAGDEDEIWAHVAGRPAGTEGYARYVRAALDEQIVDSQVPFVVKGLSGEVIGTTRYAHIEREGRSLEIGYTFYGRGARRTAANTETKYLLLRHAFELGAIRVWLQTDIRNERSQAAIARIGAAKEAELRNERIRPDGTYRTSVVYSVIADDWPATRARLEAMLARRPAAAGTRAARLSRS